MKQLSFKSLTTEVIVHTLCALCYLLITWACLWMAATGAGSLADLDPGSCIFWFTMWVGMCTGLCILHVEQIASLRHYDTETRND